MIIIKTRLWRDKSLDALASSPISAQISDRRGVQREWKSGKITTFTMANIKIYILVLLCLGFIAVNQAQLTGLANLVAGPKGRMLKMLAYRSPALQRGLATLQDMKIAKRLGCHKSLDNESPLRAILPLGCTAQKDICPYTRPMTKCLQVGIIGMCCPYYVNEKSIKSAKMYAKWSKLSEIMA